MNWDAIGALGEIAGAIAVVATLFYLSRQVRQNSDALNRANDYAQASSLHESNELYVQVYSALVHDAEMAEIYDKALQHETLSRVEAVRFSHFVNSYLAWLEDLFFQQSAQLGVASIGDPFDLIAQCAPYINRLLQTDAAGAWWRAEATLLYSPGFVDAINAALSEQARDT